MIVMRGNEVLRTLVSQVMICQHFFPKHICYDLEKILQMLARPNIEIFSTSGELQIE